MDDCLSCTNGCYVHFEQGCYAKCLRCAGVNCRFTSKSELPDSEVGDAICASCDEGF